MDNKAQALAARVADRIEEIIDFLQELIAIPTPNPPGENYSRIAQVLTERFEALGVSMARVMVPATTLTQHHIDGTGFPRPALIGRWGDAPGRSLHLHGHFDVVPADRPEQYRPHRADGRIWGRGSADMKGGLAAMWGALYVLQDLGLSPKRRITLTLTPDEESGGETGIGHLLSAGLVHPDEIAFLIMPECTSGNIWNASKGALVVDVIIEGQAAHSTLPHLGHNAFEDMLAVAGALVALRKKVETRRSRFAVEDPRAAYSAMTLGGEGGGGHKFNIVPGRYHFTVDRRPIPEEPLEAVREELFAVQTEMRSRDIDVRFETWLEASPSLTEPSHPGCIELARTIAEVTGCKPRFLLCPGFLDIRHFNSRGVPAVACGPGRLEVAHGPHEFVAESDLRQFVVALALSLTRI